jgi:sugar lactone lactonase YvrE
MKTCQNIYRFFVLGIALAVAPLAAPAQTYTWTTIAGLAGTPAGNVDGIGSAARLSAPFGVAVDGVGNLLVADSANKRIKKLTPMGTNWSVASVLGGFPNSGNRDGVGTNAAFSMPVGLGCGGPALFYLVDSDVSYLKQITLTGGGWSATNLDRQNGGGLGGGFDPKPTAVAMDSTGNAYVALKGAHAVFLVTQQGVNWEVPTVIGVGVGGTTGGSVEGTNKTARFNAPQGIGLDGAGNVYVADTGNNTIRKIVHVPFTTNWVTSTIAGLAGISGFYDGTNGGALFSGPNGLAVDSSGNIFVADANNNAIRKLTAQGTNWVVTTIGGLVNGGHGSADGAGMAASFYHPAGIAVDNEGRLFVADYLNNTIRMGVPSAVTNPPPALQIASAGGAAFVLWPSSASGYVLQTTTNVDAGPWVTVTDGITTNLVFSGPMTNAQNFYRLQSQ